MPCRRIYLLQALCSSALLLAALGCASPGQPKPPSLHIPAPATGLHAQRIGDRVHLTWSTPADSTDGGALRGPITAALCRDSPAPAHPSPDCHRVGSFPVAPGPSEADDSLPPALLIGAPALLLYRIQLFNSSSRAAPPSPPAWSASGPAPPPVGPITVRAERQGALITWTPSPSPFPVVLRRTLVAVPPQSGPKAAEADRGRTPMPAAAAHSPSTSRRAEPQVVMLRAAAASRAVDASSGLVDPGVQPLTPYTYTAQRIQTLTLPATSAPGGTVTVELRGLPSPPATFLFRDTFPPRAPAGLLGVGNPGNGADPATDPPSIDLSWEPGQDPDLQGYNVYRAGSVDGQFRRINASAIPGPAFRDLDVHPGETFVYRVTAVDRTGNESAPSTPLVQTVPRP